LQDRVRGYISGSPDPLINGEVLDRTVLARTYSPGESGNIARPQVPFYAHTECNDEKQLFLDAVCCRLEPAIYPPGETVYECNDSANCMFIVTKVRDYNCNNALKLLMLSMSRRVQMLPPKGVCRRQECAQRRDGQLAVQVRAT
jgi:hypothetical protein